jgi:hypothetical protein
VDRASEKWKPNMKVLKAMIQYVKDTKRFQARATVIGEEVVEEAGVAQGREERDDDVGGSL